MRAGGVVRRAVVAAVGIAATVALAGSVAPVAPAGPIRVLQLNLCDSGMAACYTNRAVSVAAAVIRAELPDVVALNESCRDGVSALAETLDAHRDGRVVWAFQPALNRRTGAPFRCLGSGQPFGNGIIVHLSAGQDFRQYGGTHPDQDARDSEDRAWVCIAVVGGPLACATHLAHSNAEVALAQCGYLVETVVPSVSATRVGVVLAGDLNVPADRVPSCLPPGYHHVGDDGLQHIIVSPDVTVGSRRLIDLAGATDHPGLLVTVLLSPPRAATAEDH
jgi:hypothetical protein